MKKMKNILLLLICVITLSITGYAQNPGLINDLNAKFRKYNLVELDSRVELANVKAGKGMTLLVGGRRLALSVVENDLRSADYRLVFKTATGDVEVPRPENTTFKGRVIGDSFSIVRLALDGRKVEGVIITGNNEYYIEPARTYSLLAADDEFIIYEPQDVINRKEIICPLTSRVEAGMRMINAKFSNEPFKNIFAKNSLQSFARNLPPGDRILNLSTDADLEYIKIFGGKATQYARIQAISNINETLNVVEGLYETSVDVTFNIPYQGGWLVQDPYNPCATSECVLEKFKDYWNTNRPPATFDGRNAALLFTGKSVVNYNLAYVAVICNFPDYSYAMLVGNFPAQGYGNYRYGAAAHEISHLFSAQHIEGQNLINNPDCYNSIQGPSDPNRPFYGSLRMCQFTINEVNTHIQQNYCLLIE
ncbi:MAG: M12 family metallo-peptidase [Pyrinomonadaceae bacterium]